MLAIKLRRVGKKNRPFYQIIVIEHKVSIQSKYVDKIGHYDPIKKIVVLDKKQALEWMNKGAKPSNAVSKLFKKEGLEHKSIVIKIFKTKSKVELEQEKKEKEAQKAKEDAVKEVEKAKFEAEKAAKDAEKKESAQKESATPEKSEDKPEQKSEEKTSRQSDDKKPEAK